VVLLTADLEVLEAAGPTLGQVGLETRHQHPHLKEILEELGTWLQTVAPVEVAALEDLAPLVEQMGVLEALVHRLALLEPL